MAKEAIISNKNKKDLNIRVWWWVLGGVVLTFLVLLFWVYLQNRSASLKISAQTAPKSVDKQVKKEKTEAKAGSKSAVLASPKGLGSKNSVSIPTQSGRSLNVPILYYHYVGNNPNPEDKARDYLSIPPDKFEEQMAYIANGGYNSISLDTMYAALKGNASLPPKPIILTFDDGYIDFYVNAFPVLRKYNLHATSFIPTGLIGQGYYLSWSQIKEMDATGLIFFQAHTVHHPTLTAIPYSAVLGEVTTSKRVLEQQLGKPVNFFAYPYGISNSSTWEAVKNAGFVGAVGTWYGNTVSEGTIFNLPRIRINGAWSIEDFKKRI